MTTKEALGLAINIMQDKAIDNEYDEAISLLRRLQRRDMVSKWTQETIIAALDEWKDKNGRPPTATNLIEPGMPGANIIQKHFGMRAGAFLRRRYPPDNNTAPPINRYGFQNQADWLSCFREQFLKHRDREGFSSKTYNMYKDEGTPLWLTIARHCGTTQWTKLMELADVKYIKHTEQIKTGSLHVSNIKSPWLERLEAAVAKRELLDRQLIEAISRDKK